MKKVIETCRFGFFFPLPSTNAINEAVELFKTARYTDEEDPDQLILLPPGFRRDEDVLAGFSCFAIECGSKGIRITSSDGGHRAAAVFIQRLMQLHHPNGYFTFHWATFWGDSAAQRSGAYIITAEKIISFDSEVWLRKKVKPLKRQRIGNG